MSGFQFPPPASESGDGWEDVDYPSADRGGRFILPPPRRTPGGDVDEVAQRISEEISWIRETAAHADEEVHNLGTVVEDYGDALERKVEPWAVPTVAPLSQTINRRADATFQLQGFMSLGGWTGSADGHRHPMGAPGGADIQLGEGWSEGNRTYLAFITPAINRAYEQLHFMVGAVSGTASAMDIAIYVADEDRVLTRQVGNVRVSDQIGSGEALVTVPFDRWVATQGSYIAVAVRQFASGNQRPLLGLHDTPRPLSNVVFPRKITARWTSTSALPAVIDGTNALDFEADWFVPYIELSEAIGIDYRVFTEGWPDVGSEIGRPWVPLTSQGIGSSGGHTSAYGSGLRVSMYDTPLSTDYVRVRSSIVNDGFGGQNFRSTLIIRGTNDLRSGVGLSAISRTRYELIQWSNLSVDSDEGWDDRTVVATIGRNPADGDQIEIDYLDGEVTVRINGQTRIDAQPVDGPEGAAGRFLGIQNRRQSFITTSYSPWLGPWSARDLPQSNGDEDEDEGDGEG